MKTFQILILISSFFIFFLPCRYLPCCLLTMGAAGPGRQSTWYYDDHIHLHWYHHDNNDVRAIVDARGESIIEKGIIEVEYKKALSSLLHSSLFIDEVGYGYDIPDASSFINYDDNDYCWWLPVSWVEYQKALYEVDPILRNVRKVGQVHRIITRQCLRIIMQWRRW